MKGKKKLRLLCCFLVITAMVLGLSSAVFADTSGSGADAVYVSQTGSDTSGDGTADKPYATLAKAVNEAKDGATVYVMSNLTVNKCARYYSKNLTIKSTAENNFTITRGDTFDTIDDTNRSWYNPAMIEVGGTPDQQDASLRLENITLDDNGLKEGTKFIQAGKTTGNNKDIVQDAIIATYNNTATITLGNGAVLKNFGGMSAVRIADGILVMEAGSKIIDDKVTDRTKADKDDKDENGPAGAVWMQGGKVEMQAGSEISNVIGRAIYADGGEAVVNGTISGIVPDKEMWQGGSGLAVHARNNADAVLGETGKVNGITNSTKSVDVNDAIAVATYGSDFDMQKGAEISDITNCTVLYANDVGNDYSHNMLINGKIYRCTTNGGSMARSWYGLITLGHDCLVTENTANSGVGLFYTNNGSRYVIEGKVIKNIAPAGAFYLANQSGGRVEALIKEGAEISENSALGIRVNNGAWLTMDGGKICNNGENGVRLDGKSGGYKKAHFTMNGGEISGNKGHGVYYKFREADTQSTVKLIGGKIINNKSDNGIQISAAGGTACDSYEYLYMQKGVLQGSRKVHTSFGILTFDEDYPEIYLGTASKEANNKILELVRSMDTQKEWELLGSNGLWFKLTDADALNFETTRAASDNELYAAYIPVDENGVPETDAALTLLPIYNTDPADISLDNLEKGQSYALRIVESITPVEKYTVEFDTNGGTFEDENVPISETVNEGSRLNAKYWSDWVPVYQNEDGEDIHFFDGWYEVKEDGSLAGKPWDKDSRVLRNMTLRAKWVNYADVTFDANGGTLAEGTENPVTVKVGDTVAEPADPSRSGYTFKGWFLGDTEYDFKDAVKDDIRLTAKWAENTAPADPSEPAGPTDKTPASGDSADTGDDSNPAVWMGLLALAAAGGGAALFAGRRKKTN